MTIYSNSIALYRNFKKKNINILIFCILHEYIATFHGIMCQSCMQTQNRVYDLTKRGALDCHICFYERGISNLSQRWIGWEIIHINELHILYSLLFQTKICRKKTKDNFSGKQNTSKIKMYFFLFFLQIHVKNKHILYNHASITALQIYVFHLSGHQTKFNV